MMNKVLCAFHTIINARFLHAIKRLAPNNDFELLTLSCFGAPLVTDRSSGEDTSSTFFQLESAILLGDKKDKLLPSWEKKIQLKMGETADDRWIQRRNKHIPVRRWELKIVDSEIFARNYEDTSKSFNVVPRDNPRKDKVHL